MNEHSLAVVMPAYNAAGLLPRTLRAALDAAAGGTVLVVDPGSTDRTAAVAEELGATVVRLPVRAGPARARNIGVAHVEADIVLFVDADCALAEDVVARVRGAFEAEPELVSLTGSYDSAPPDPGFFSQYMNLRHYYTHHRARRTPATFWAGCGAVRRDAFLAAGGFDERRFPRPQIEDIELGYRLRAAGNTRLDPSLQVTHLKRWTLWSTVYTDVVERGIPWAQLMLEQEEVPDDLNLRLSQRVAAALAPLALLAIPALLWSAVTARWPLVIVASLLLGCSIALQRGFIAELLRLRGVNFALRAWLFHQVHLTYSGVIFCGCWVRHRFSSPARSRSAA